LCNKQFIDDYGVLVSYIECVSSSGN
jgi:hypothetical protein